VGTWGRRRSRSCTCARGCGSVQRASRAAQRARGPGIFSQRGAGQPGSGGRDGAGGAGNAARFHWSGGIKRHMPVKAKSYGAAAFRGNGHGGVLNMFRQRDWGSKNSFCTSLLGTIWQLALPLRRPQVFFFELTTSSLMHGLAHKGEFVPTVVAATTWDKNTRSLNVIGEDSAPRFSRNRRPQIVFNRLARSSIAES
jgi:hypothetical protein